MARLLDELARLVLQVAEEAAGLASRLGAHSGVELAEPLVRLDVVAQLGDRATGSPTGLDVLVVVEEDLAGRRVEEAPEDHASSWASGVGCHRPEGIRWRPQ